MRKHIFNAGPGVLPQQVLDQVSEAVKDLDGTGESILEISHRGKNFKAIYEEAISLVRELLAIGDGYTVNFLQGGASLQFAMIPYNLLGDGQTAAYVETGVWAKKAIKEAQLWGDVNIVGSSADKNFNFIPKGYEVPSDSAYFHLTSNNTIYGTQVHDYPEVSVPYIVDMSSDIFCRPLDGTQFDMIYAGAQKNMGPSGTTLIVIKDELAGRLDRKIPTLLNYKTHIENEMFNTPSVIAIYTSMLVMRWIKENGGVEAMGKINEAKASKLYNEIDENPLFKGTAEKEDRSIMNVCFVMEDPTKEEDFMKSAMEKGIIGIKGHRSVGGFRASIYNACPESSVDVLVEHMKEFAASYA